MCDKALDNYSHAFEFVHDCYKTQEMCDKAVGIDPSTILFVSECYETQEISLIIN